MDDSNGVSEETKQAMKRAMACPGVETAASHALDVTVALMASMGPARAHQGAAYMLAASGMMTGMTREAWAEMMLGYFDACVERDAKVRGAS